jgi:hypothetical protein
VLVNRRRGEEADHLQRLRPCVEEVVRRVLGQYDHVASPHRPAAVVEEQVPAPPGDELRLLGGVCVAPEPLAGPDREVDGRRPA